MSNLIYFRNHNELTNEHRLNNLNKISNDEAILDLPSRYNDNSIEKNNYSLYDVQKVINSDISSLNINRIEANIPNNDYIMNFITYENKIIIDDNSNHNQFIKNTLGLRFNPASSQNGLNSLRDHSNNNVLCNRFNYFDLKRGKILKRAEFKSFDSSINVVYFTTDISENIISNTIVHHNTYANNNSRIERNFVNLLPTIRDISNEYTKLYIDDYQNNLTSNDYVNSRINLYNKELSTRGVQQLNNNTTEPFLTHLDIINTRVKNYLNSSFDISSLTTDTSFLDPFYYNINFNEKSWFKGNIKLEGERGINIGDFYLDSSSEGHFMYQYSINEKLETNNLINLLSVDNSNIPYTVFGNILDGKMNIDHKFIKVKNYTEFDKTDLSNSFIHFQNIYSSNDYNINLYKFVCKLACLYFKDPSLNFMYYYNESYINFFNWSLDNLKPIIQDNSNNINDNINYHFIPLVYSHYQYNNVLNIFDNDEHYNKFTEYIRNIKDFFYHLSSVLIAYPEINTTSTSIGLSHPINISYQINDNSENSFNTNIPQITTSFQDNIFEFNLLNESSSLDTIILKGISHGFIEIVLEQSYYRINKLESENLSTIKNLYIFDSSDITIKLDNSPFSNCNKIEILDFTGINGFIDICNNSFNNMEKLTTIIINETSIRDMNNFNDIIDNLNDSTLKKIYIKKEPNNNLSPMILIKSTNNNIVIMEIPYNSNALYGPPLII